MVTGGLDVVEEVSGRGIPAWGYALGGPRVGSAPGASTRGTLWVSLPRASESVERLLLSIGVFVDHDVRPPISWKLIVDGVSVSREFRPQFQVETDWGVYMKAIYDVKPILSRRVVERESHKIVVIRDAVKPVRMADAVLYARYSSEKGVYSVSYWTGAVALEPGEGYQVNANLGRSMEGKRRAGVIVHSPYHDASFRVIAGGSQPETAVGEGSHYIEASVPYKGSPVPVYIRYEDPGYRFYPRIAVVSDVFVAEVKAPEPRPRLVVERVSVKDSRLVIEGYVENVGDDVLEPPMLVVLALGVRLARKKLPRLEPGGRTGFRVEFAVDRLPIRPSRANVRLVWRRLGETRIVSREVSLPTAPS